MLARVHEGRRSFWEQPNGSEVSMPSTTASLPSSITSRACSASVTIRYHPRPSPPYCASMNAWVSYASLACLRTAVISSQDWWVPGLIAHSALLLVSCTTRIRCPPRQARSTQR